MNFFKDKLKSLTFITSLLICNVTFAQADEDQNERVLRLKIYTQNSYEQGSTSSDAIRIEFTNDGSNEIDNRDVVKMNNLDENLARLHGGTLLTVENREQPDDGEVFPLFVNQYSANNYVLKFENDIFDDVKVILNDNFNGNTLEIDENNFLYYFSIDQTIGASSAFNRFSIEIEELVSLSLNDFDKEPNFILSPNPVNQNFLNIESASFAGEKVNVQFYNQVGKLIYKSSILFPVDGNLKINNLDISSGVYLVRVQGLTNQVTKKLIKR